ncbi:MAG TPA: AAA family ATPase [Candidatus Binatia bacterium]|nr:AAA family ATPase [Candidatus Binatia bacterium]
MMERVLQKRLAEFVDRDEEMRRFRTMLKSSDKPIMVVWGEAGIGKTSLLARMIHECAVRNLRKSEIVWKDVDPPDYMAIMRKIRDDVGVGYFNEFTDLVNYFTEAGYEQKVHLNLTAGSEKSVRVAENAQISGSEVGDVAGLIIKDSMIVVPRPDLAVPEAERRAKLTYRFFECISRAVETEPLVVFMDAVEKMAPDTEAWVWQELLGRVMQTELNHIKFVLCGRKPPPDDRDWELFIEAAGLKPLGPTDIVSYLKNRSIELDNKGLRAVALTILTSSKGIPIEVARQVDALERLLKDTQSGRD